MSLIYKPHTLTFYPASEPVNAVTKVVTVPVEGTGVAVEGQLMPISAEEAFEKTQLNLSSPHCFLCDLEPVSDVPIKPNIRAVDARGRNFAVRGKPQEPDAISALSYGDVTLELLEFRGS